ncbi:MAG: small multi-drug export protein [Romboutsia sp.]
MEYLKIMLLSMVPITELRGAIPIGIALNLNPTLVYIVSVIGSTLVAIPLILTFRHILSFIKERNILNGLVKKIDRKIDNGMKKLNKASVLGIILFVGVPLPTTGTWTASAIASILHMRLKHAFWGVLIGNMLAGIIVSAISLQLI